MQLLLYIRILLILYGFLYVFFSMLAITVANVLQELQPMFTGILFQISASDIINSLKEYKYLDLPRLNRPSTYNELCPPNLYEPDSRLVIVYN